MSIGQQIAGLRKSRGLTQREVAGRCGITVNFLSLIENDDRDASLTTLRRIAAVLGAKISLVLEDEVK